MRSSRGARSVASEHYLLAGILLLAVVLRFAALGSKSYWEDEGITLRLIHQGYGSMLHSVRVGQPDPPLYFSLAWVWVRLFGYGEAALRSLSAIAGVLTIPMAYLIARRLVGVRAGLIAAALLAVNPFLIWYSQEARTYALFVLLATVSIWCLLRALDDPSPSRLTAWAVAVLAMLAAHYFAVFLAVGEAGWLMWRTYTRERRRWFLAILLLAGVGVVVVLIASNGGPAIRANWGGLRTLPKRIVTVPSMFLVGFEAVDVQILAAVAALLVALLLPSFLRSGAWRQRGVLLCLSLVIGGVCLPLLAALIGQDYFIPRNVIFALVPTWIVLGAAFSATWERTSSRALAALLGALSVGIVISTASTPKYHYQDWRRVATAIGPREGPRAIVIAPPIGVDALGFYLGQRLGPLRQSSTVSEIDVVAIRNRNSFELGDPPAPQAKAEPIPLGFKLDSTYHRHSFTLVRYRAPHPRAVSNSIAGLVAFDHDGAVALAERGKF